jgi:hypothetical protein
MSRYMWEWKFRLLLRRYKGTRTIGWSVFRGIYYHCYVVNLWWGFVSIVMEKKSVPKEGTCG